MAITILGTTALVLHATHRAESDIREQIMACRLSPLPQRVFFICHCHCTCRRSNKHLPLVGLSIMRLGLRFLIASSPAPTSGLLRPMQERGEAVLLMVQDSV
jgi:hypothetical protein